MRTNALKFDLPEAEVERDALDDALYALRALKTAARSTTAA
jgi:hypothetical protein